MTPPPALAALAEHPRFLYSNSLTRDSTTQANLLSFLAGISQKCRICARARLTQHGKMQPEHGTRCNPNTGQDGTRKNETQPQAWLRPHAPALAGVLRCRADR